ARNAQRRSGLLGTPFVKRHLCQPRGCFMSLDVQAIREQFPILQQTAHGKPLVYLDNAATTQKPVAVIDAVDNYYRTQNSNVHRGAHYLGDLATAALEEARLAAARFLNAEREEVIWTKGTTESLNLVAHSFGGSQLKAGDEVLVSTLEHHANIVPWQQVCERTGAALKVIPLAADGSLDLSDIDSLLTSKTKILSIAHASNALGTLNPVEMLITKARQVGAYVVL